MNITRRYRVSITLELWLNNLSKTGRSRKQALSVFVDALAVCVALWAAYSLRFGVIFSDFANTWHLFAIMPVVTILVMASLGIYRWMIRSSNRALFYQLGKATVLSSVALVLLTFLLPPDTSYARSIFLIYGLLLGCGTLSTRLLWQGLFDGGKRGEPVAIYGAGAAGAALVHSLNQGNEYRPMLMLDDDSAFTGTTLGGVRVQKPDKNSLKELLASHDVSLVILAMPSLSAAEYESKVSYIRGMGYAVQTIPTYAELVSGAAKMEHIRDISINDILGRSEVPPNSELLGMTVTGKVVMVTGAGGSIGSELCRQIAKLRPKKLVALDHSEENLYKITEEFNNVLSEDLGSESYVPVLCSVNDASSVSELLANHEVNTLYHAAAYKHVPIIEAQPEQGLRVNVYGTLSVLDAAITNRVENFVLISTDKAVRPTNAMGATKRVAELVLQAKSRLQKTTKISMVRFGNVLGSSGSVVPKFRKQIEQGGPITLTDPNVTRYFMTIPEAAQLVLQASSLAKGGDVFVLDMGEPVRIEDLAVSMVHMSGKRLERDTGDSNDIHIQIDGLRPGEKMYEELFISDSREPTCIKKIFTADEAWIHWSVLQKKLEELSYFDSPDDRPFLRAKLLDLAFFGQPGDPGIVKLAKTNKVGQVRMPDVQAIN